MKEKRPPCSPVKLLSSQNARSDAAKNPPYVASAYGFQVEPQELSAPGHLVAADDAGFGAGLGKTLEKVVRERVVIVDNQSPIGIAKEVNPLSCSPSQSITTGAG